MPAAAAERTGEWPWRNIKQEVYVRAYDSVREAQDGQGQYLMFYNQRRPHTALDNTTPGAFYCEHVAALPKSAQANIRRVYTYEDGNSVPTNGVPLITFLGEVTWPEKDASLRSADLFVFPGIQQEGQPNLSKVLAKTSPTPRTFSLDASQTH